MVLCLNKKIIVFAPHPDDEVLGCGGTILKRVTEGYEIILVVLTDGRHALSYFGIHSNPTPEEIKQVRLNEMLRATRILGISPKNLFLWNFEDGQLSSNKKEVASRVCEILKQVQPIEIYFPYEKDEHVDHQITGLIIQQCLKESNISPLGYRYSLAHNYSRLEHFKARIRNLLKHDPIFVDVSGFLQQKTLALKEYKSQTSLSYATQKQPVICNVSRFLRKHEIFYPINVAR
jgi:LmbE family N-acetylglucosaminyl deacetylase